MIATIKSIMIFVALLTEGFLSLAFIDENGRPISVNGSCCLQMLQVTAWSPIRSGAAGERYSWMQDCAPTHWTTDAKMFLLNKFLNQVNSRDTPIIWPVHSTDLNPLHFRFREEALRKDCRQQPESISSWIECVKDFAQATARQPSGVMPRTFCSGQDFVYTSMAGYSSTFWNRSFKKNFTPMLVCFSLFFSK